MTLYSELTPREAEEIKQNEFVQAVPASCRHGVIAFRSNGAIYQGIVHRTPDSNPTIRFYLSDPSLVHVFSSENEYLESVVVSKGSDLKLKQQLTPRPFVLQRPDQLTVQQAEMIAGNSEIISRVVSSYQGIIKLRHYFARYFISEHKILSQINCLTLTARFFANKPDVIHLYSLADNSYIESLLEVTHGPVIDNLIKTREGRVKERKKVVKVENKIRKRLFLQRPKPPRDTD